jgi:predicted ABC-type transport system involved in lysophospholipase L1 biosynthesis ATPase subunit
MNRPKLILADEPTGNLDEGSGDAIIDLLLSLGRAEGCALVLVTHNAVHAARCERRLFLREGGFHAA